MYILSQLKIVLKKKKDTAEYITSSDSRHHWWLMMWEGQQPPWNWERSRQRRQAFSEDRSQKTIPSTPTPQDSSSKEKLS